MIQDRNGNVRKDRTLGTGIYRVEGFDYLKMDAPPEHDGPIGEAKISRKKSEERTEGGFVVIE